MYEFFYTKFPTFDLIIKLLKDSIVGVEFLAKDTRLSIEVDNKLALKVIDQLDCYLKDSTYRFELPLKIDGSEHQIKVWQQMLFIPSGRTLTYKGIAENISSSPRAVGNACGRNKIALLIPCHRVISNSGKIGGFMKAASGYTIDIKAWLLKHENTVL